MISSLSLFRLYLQQNLAFSQKIRGMIYDLRFGQAILRLGGKFHPQIANLMVMPPLAPPGRTGWAVRARRGV
jgi:hypothetical protein